MSVRSGSATLICEIFGMSSPDGDKFVVEEGFEVHEGGANFTIPDKSPRTTGNCLNRLSRFLDYYAFLTQVPVEVVNPALWDGKEIHDMHEVVYRPVERRKQRRALAEALSLYRGSVPNYLRIALAFYRKALIAQLNGEDDEALIDLVTSLESIFSLDPNELRYRLSLRASYFLGGRNPEKRKRYFDTIWAIYNLRNKLVHGSVMPHDLDFRDLENFSRLVREAIGKLLLGGQKKKELVRRVDFGILKGSQPDLS